MHVTHKILVVMTLLATCGSNTTCRDEDGAKELVRCRPTAEARVQASRILRSPVICDGEAWCERGDAVGGYVCVDNRGGMVICPPEATKPCALNAGEPESPPRAAGSGQ